MIDIGKATEKTKAHIINYRRASVSNTNQAQISQTVLTADVLFGSACSCPPKCRIQTYEQVQEMLSHDNTSRMIAGHRALVGAMVQLAELDQLADIISRLHGVQLSKPASSGRSVSSSDWPIRLAKMLHVHSAGASPERAHSPWPESAIADLRCADCELVNCGLIHPPLATSAPSD